MSMLCERELVIHAAILFKPHLRDSLARPAKVAWVQAASNRLDGTVEVCPVSDIVSANLTSVLRGMCLIGNTVSSADSKFSDVTAIIHVASSAMGRSDAKNSVRYKNVSPEHVVGALTQPSL